MPTFASTAAETIPPPTVSAGTIDSNPAISLLPSRGSGREAGVMTWRRWLPVAGLVLLGLCLLPSGTLQAQGTPLEEIPYARKLVASAGVEQDRFGSKLAVSGDILVVAAPSAVVDRRFVAGAAYVFLRDPASGVWVERKRLVAQDGAAFDAFAGSIAVDGDTVVLGASRAKVGGVLQQGAAYVFERHAGGVDNWGQVAKLTDASVGAIGNLGSSVAIKGDLLAVGASRGGGSRGDGFGLVTIFERDRGGPGAWGKVTAIEAGDGGTFPESFGSAVALDGDLLLVGAVSADVSYFGEDDGAAYLFRRNGTDRDRWDLIARLTAAEAALCPGGRTLAELSLESPEVRLAVQRCAQEDSRTDHDAFGAAVALAGDTIVVGAPSAEAAAGPVVGAAYVFRRDPSGADRWDQVAKLTGSDVLASTSPGFGGALALASDTLLVGAPGVEVGLKLNQGAAYLFERGGGGPDAWGEVRRLAAADGLSGEAFGSAVALDGGHEIIGASGYALGRGAVYLAGDPPPPEPAFPPTGELASGGTIQAPGGVLLGAVADALAEALPVWVHQVTAPAVALLPPATPLGAFYNVGATRTTVPRLEMPLGLAFPVPEGADTDHLAIAWFVPPGAALSEPDPTEAWGFLRGVYDPARRLFSVVLPALLTEGATAVLIQHPGIATLAMPMPAARTGAPSRDVVSTPVFAPYCEHRTTDCDDGDVTRFKLALNKAFEKFAEFKHCNPHPQLGYCNPYLQHRILILGQDLIFEQLSLPVPIEVQYYADVLKTSNCSTNKYQYHVIKMCYNRGVTDESFQSSVYHEMFHAFQHGYSTVENSVHVENEEEYKWLIEGTAEAARESDTEMHRSNNLKINLRPITTTLLATKPEILPYQAQDFWVYFGQKIKRGLDYLRPLFERGGTTAAAAAFFDEVHLIFDGVPQTSLAAEYWAWVKNQAIEKTIKFDGVPVGPCNIESRSDGSGRDDPVVGRPQPPGNPVEPEDPLHPFRPTPLEYPSRDGPSTVEKTLERLTATVVEIQITEDIMDRAMVSAATSEVTLQPEGHLDYKVYLNNEAECDKDKADRPGESGERTLNALKKGDVIYVVLANTSYEPGSRVKYKVTMTPVP